jgi:hypothetical protein
MFSWGIACETYEWIDLGFFLQLQPLHRKVKGLCVYGGGGGACGGFVAIWVSFNTSNST